MIINNFYNYIIIMLFEKMYKYEYKKEISIDKLKKIKNILYEEILDIYKNGRGHTYYDKVDQWQGEVYFNNINEEKALKDFLEEYEDYFYLDNGILYLKKDIKYNDISELLRQIKIKENVPNRFNIVDDNRKLIDILEIKSIEKIIMEYSKVEKLLENLYYKLYTNEDSENLRKKIKSLLFMRHCFFANVSQMKDYKVDAFRNIASNCCSEQVNIYYDKNPIDLKLWESQYENEDDILGDIDARIYDITQYAIFGKKQNSLYLNKIVEDLNDYYMSECFISSKIDIDDFDPCVDYTDMLEIDILSNEQFEEDYENQPELFKMLDDPSDEFYVLYMNYLNNLNNFIEFYGENEELLFAKRRLLYVLDKPNLMIFDEKNFKEELNKTKNIELDEEPFDFVLDEIYFIAQEIFMAPYNEYTIRKLLLVATYYDLTKDNQIKEIIEEFKDDSKYNFFHDIIINNFKNTNNNTLPQDIKRLILTPNDKNKN